MREHGAHFGSACGDRGGLNAGAAGSIGDAGAGTAGKWPRDPARKEKLAGFRCADCGSERGVSKGDRIICLGCSKSIGAPPTFPSSPDAGPARWRAIVEIEAPSEAALARRLAGLGAAFSSSSAVHERELRVAGGVVRIERMGDDVTAAAS